MPGLDRLIRGILQYRLNILPQLVHQFKLIKDNPEPKAVMFSCIDSRVLMTRLLQTNAGDMLMVRNAGNLIPHAHNCRHAPSTEAGALELGCVINNIDYVMVCGHSDCKAMNLLLSVEGKQQQNPGQSPLTHWVTRHGAASYAKYKELKKNGDSKPLVFQGETPNTLFEAYIDPKKKLLEADRFSQINTLQQLENINSHSIVQEKLAKGKVKLHAFWFDIYSGEFFMFSRKQKLFVQVDENTIHDLMNEYREGATS